MILPAYSLDLKQNSISDSIRMEKGQQPKPTLPFQRGANIRSSKGRVKRIIDASDEPLFKISKTFRELVTNGLAFADKTMFLQELLLSSNDNIRLTMPRAMGKTVLLSMVDEFFRITHDDAEQEKKRKLFEQTQINELEPGFVEKHLGKHPVIKISFLLVKGDTLNKVLFRFTDAIRGVYESLNISEMNLTAVNRINVDTILSGEAVDESILALSLAKLMGILREHYKTRVEDSRVIVLIDEYDVPVRHLATSKCVPDEEQQKIAEFHADIIKSVFKDNDDLLFGICAGILRSEEGELSGVRFRDCNFINGEFCRYFGFSDSCIKEFTEEMTKMGVEVPDEHFEMAKNWYNGYACELKDATSGELTTETFYNPYSMSCFLNNYKDNQQCDISTSLQCYWTQSGLMHNLKAVFKRKDIGKKVESLLRDDDVQLDGPLIETFTRADYNSLARCSEEDEIGTEFETLLFSFLVHTGYLVFKEGFVSVPNDELRIYLKQMITQYFVSVYKFDIGLANRVSRAFAQLARSEEKNVGNNADYLRQEYSNFLVKWPNELVDNESEVHATLTFMCARIFDMKHLMHEKSHTHGGRKYRPDLAFHLKGTTVVVETKYDINGTVEDALEEARYYRRVVFNTRNGIWAFIKRFIFIGFHVDKHKNVTINHFVEDGTKSPPQMRIPKKFSKKI